MDPNELPNETKCEAPPVYEHTAEGDFVVRSSLIERLLSPQSLQWMMLVGGGMLVIGFVVWLWSIGLFDNPVVVAVGMGGAIAALIGAGIAIVKLTRYQLAGQGLTLLGAMAMPLQLWFYHAQDLINLNDGGHLWIPAAGFCLVYAAIARVLRNPAFVYTLVGGVVLTGMLLAADQAVNQFWNLLPQVTFLVGLGWVCVFAEKWFVESGSDFSRAKFGQSFYKSGVVTIVSGLSLLLASQIVGFFYETISLNGFTFVQYEPSVVQQFWAIGILIVTAVGITIGLISNEDNKSQQFKLNSLFAIILWIGICLVGLLQITVTLSAVAAVIAAVVIAINLYQLFTSKTNAAGGRGDFADLTITTSLLLCLFAHTQFCFQYTPFAGEFVISALGFTSFAQIALAGLAALSCTILPEGLGKTGKTNRTIVAIAGSATAIMAVWTGAWLFDVTHAAHLAVAGLSVPLVLSLVNLTGLVSNKSLRCSLKRIAATMTVVQMTMYTIYFGIGFSGIVPSQYLWIVVCLVAALIHYLCCFVRSNDDVVRVGFNRMLTYGYLIASGSIVLTLFGMDFPLAIITTPALVGLLLIVVGKLLAASTLNDEFCTARWALVADYGRIFALFANSAGMLLAINMFVSGGTSVSLAVAIGVQWLVAVLAISLSKSEGWKNGFIASTILLTATQFAVVNEAIPLSVPTKVEFATVLVGVILLAIGHISWAKEDQSTKASTTAALYFGSLMTAIPLMVALFCYRYLDVANVFGFEQLNHEIVVLVTLLSLLGAGIMCRIRSTTMVGAAGIVVYIASLLTMIPLPEKLQSISVVMMAGGAVFFTTAIMLSLYRDRIIAIPERFRQGEGVFQVLKWR